MAFVLSLFLTSFFLFFFSLLFLLSASEIPSSSFLALYRKIIALNSW